MISRVRARRFPVCGQSVPTTAILPGFDSFGALPDVDLLSIQAGGAVERCFKQLVTTWVIDHSKRNVAFGAQGDAHGEIRNTLCEVQTAADGIDNPKLWCVQGKGSIVGTLFGEDPGVWKFREDGRDDGFLNCERSFRNHIPVTFPLQVTGIREARPGDFTALARRASCYIERTVGHLEDVLQCELHDSRIPG